MIYLNLLIKHQVFCEMFFELTQVRLVTGLLREIRVQFEHEHDGVIYSSFHWTGENELSSVSCLPCLKSFVCPHWKQKCTLLHSQSTAQWKTLNCYASTDTVACRSWVICWVIFWQPNMELLSTYPVFNKNHCKRNKKKGKTCHSLSLTFL